MLSSSRAIARIAADRLHQPLWKHPAIARAARLQVSCPKLTPRRPFSLKAKTMADSPHLGYASLDGEFRRKPSVFRNCISSEPGSEFTPEKDRYHLYISWACPWAHRTALVRELKGLTDIISLSVVDWYMGEGGWRFKPDTPGATDDPVNGASWLSDIYFKVNPDYTGRYTVPVLWDKKTSQIVNNESSEIIRMFYTQFDDIIEPQYRGINFYKPADQAKIDEVNEWVYDTINNGVYKSGFASQEDVYIAHVKKVFESLDRVEAMLAKSKYLLGDELTEADIRLYPTIVRFDPVYVQHFKCNIGMIRHDYPHIHDWLRHLYWDYPEFSRTTNFDHIKYHYTRSHKQINPFSITPYGPLPNMVPKSK
ncbi:glutathione S-transferase [Dipodascopsis tothii]|uniref:glutathione S-transferase n=1 Tax=Dipodascopsis tothii TaxID=44089 RepID=UPI0034CE1F15